MMRRFYTTSYVTLPERETDKNGKTLLTVEDQARRWVEHIKETLNQPVLADLFTPDPPISNNDLAVNTGKITSDERVAVM